MPRTQPVIQKVQLVPQNSKKVSYKDFPEKPNLEQNREIQ